MSLELLNTLTFTTTPIVVKNIGMAVANGLSMGITSALKKSVDEIKEKADQSNDNLFYWQVATFLKNSADLPTEEVSKFLEQHPQGYRLGAEVFKILESTYIEKQAELISIAFKQMIRRNISDQDFHKYIHIIVQLNHYLIREIDKDLTEVKTYFKKTPDNTDIDEKKFISSEVYSSFDRILNTLGFIEEKPQYIDLQPNDYGQPKTGIDLEKEYSRTPLYFNFYSKIYQYLEL